ncbi:MAG TPA: hypothetical protein VFZ61_25585, partial [Polyangiales bacterium]
MPASSHRSPTLACLLLTLLACGDPDATAVDPPLALELTAADPPCTLEQIIAPATFDTTERSGVSADGRVFFIGTRPVQNGESASWLAELVPNVESGALAPKNLVKGALGGTADGTLSGTPAGDACVFSGMAVRAQLIYAGCYALDGRASLIQVDLARGSVRAGAFSTCNAEPSVAPCKSVDVYPNGMAIDAQGRVYASSFLVHLTGVADGASILQIEVGAPPAEPQKLAFRYRPWVTSNLVADGLAPNGVQIERDTLYYAAGANINAVPISSNGRAGRLRVQYHGIFLTYIDDFAVHDGNFVLARTLPLDLAAIAPNRFGVSRVLGTCALPDFAI